MRVRHSSLREAMSPELRELLEGAQSLPCQYSQRAMMRVIRGLAGRRLYIARREVVAPEQLALAIELLNQRMRVAECRDALMVRLGVSRPTAYRLITAALQARAGVVPATVPHAGGLRKLALALDDDQED